MKILLERRAQALPYRLCIIFISILIVSFGCYKYANGRPDVDEQGSVIGAKIINGEIAQVGRYQYIAALWPSPGCGGALISPDVVLTAAHCVWKLEDDEYIYPTKINLGTQSLKYLTGETIEVIDAVVHPEYISTNGQGNDIALLKLRRSSNIPPVQLVSNPTFLQEGKKLTLLGWGMTELGDKSDLLKEASVHYMKTSECKKEYKLLFGPFFKFSKEICGEHKDQSTDCFGDSGGPVIIKGNSSETDVLVGIVSWGVECHMSIPSIFSDVRSLRPWIKNAIFSAWKLSLPGVSEGKIDKNKKGHTRNSALTNQDNYTDFRISHDDTKDNHGNTSDSFFNNNDNDLSNRDNYTDNYISHDDAKDNHENKSDSVFHNNDHIDMNYGNNSDWGFTNNDRNDDYINSNAISLNVHDTYQNISASKFIINEYITKNDPVVHYKTKYHRKKDKKVLKKIHKKVKGRNKSNSSGSYVPTSTSTPIGIVDMRSNKQTS